MKKFEYRGDPNEEWSNKYWWTGAPPNQASEWKTLADLLIAQEKTCYSAGSGVVRAYGYDDNADDANSVWQYDYEMAGEIVYGTLNGLVADLYSGDQAGQTWWKTSRKTSRGKWIYLRKFFHDGFVDPANTDNINAATLGAYEAFATWCRTAGPQSRIIRSQAQDEALQASGASTFVGTRTLKRRGRRPTAAP